MYRVSRLDNGLTVATAEMPHMNSVSLGVWIGVGSRYEPEPLNGVCHFLEHLLFKGTKKRSAREISEAVEGIGGYLNAFTSEEMTCFHARAASDHLPELLDVLMDMLLNSRFEPGDIAKEREVIKEEIAMYLDEPQHQVQELLNATLWPNQPLGRPITGTPETLDAMRRPELVDYLRHNYVTGSALIVAAGRVTHGGMLRAVRPYAAKFQRGARPRFTGATDGQPRPRIALVTKKTEQTQLALGIRTCSRQDDRRYALRLLSTILGENMSSRLFQRLREDLGLVYSVFSTPSFFSDTGDLVISAGVDADKLPKTLRLITGELARLRQRPPAPTELRRARDYLIGQLELAQESTEAQMNWVGEQLLGYGTIHTPAQTKRRLGTVTVGEVCAVARDFFRPERMNLALVSPVKSAASLAKHLTPQLRS